MENFKEVESKWQNFWEEHPELVRANDLPTALQLGRAGKKYVLVEFPYPSGSGLHIGHAFTFTGGDIYARFKRMQGFNVMFPMGWDAFGLPTENYAIKMKRKPQEITKENTDMFRSQMKKLAFSFDWSREVNTTDPNYYKWTQWIFIQLYKKGLAYKKEMPINWCPKCKIGLANEEVVNGRCERCGTEVERRTIAQWVLKITEYADRLIEDLRTTDYVERVKQSQINWIGKSDGAKIKFKIKDRDEEVEIFTTRPDTLFGATFMVVAPEHELVSQLVEKNIQEYLSNARKKSELERTELSKDKTGVFSGLYAINPVNKKEIPIWISDFVLSSYGTGAIMAVPAHDERDFAFAKKFGLEIVEVYDKENKIVNSDFLNGLDKEKALEKMIKWLEEKGIGERTASYHLRDWIFSRQHYWGEPIPMINCPEHGWQPVPEDQLPVKLPEVEQYEPTDTGESPLANISEWVDTVCPICGKPSKRETDTMPNWAGSDWYYLRYIDPHNDIVLASGEKMKYWMPVDLYIGGDEHTTLHLLYSRFIYKFLYDIGVVPTSEPYQKRVPHGVILGPDNQRMSKSRGNVIVPEDVTDKYGVDVMRMYLMFMGPFDGTMAWDEKTLMGVKRFLERFNKYINDQLLISNDQKESSKEVKVILNKTIKNMTDMLEQLKYNTAIAQMMELLNKISNDQLLISNEDIKTLVKLIAPFAPYMAEELWASYAKATEGQEVNLPISVHISEWPAVEEKYLIEEKIRMAVAINGKVRDEIEVESQKLKVESKEEIIEAAKKLEKIKNWINGKQILKEIYIPGKMVNLVVKD